MVSIYIYIFQLYIRQLHNLYIEKKSCVGIVIQLMMINWCDDRHLDLGRQNFKGFSVGCSWDLMDVLWDLMGENKSVMC